MNRKLFNAQLTQYATPTVTGEGSVTCQDGIKCYLPGLQVDGNTFQQTYEGYNKLISPSGFQQILGDNYVKYDISTQIYDINYINSGISASICHFDTPIPAGTPYTLLAEVINDDFEISEGNGTFALGLYKKDDSGVAWAGRTLDLRGLITSKVITQSYTTTQPTTDIWIFRNTSSTYYTKNLKVRFMVYFGDRTITEWQPYVGGIASPNPGQVIIKYEDAPVEDLTIPASYWQSGDDVHYMLCSSAEINLPEEGKEYKLDVTNFNTGNKYDAITIGPTSEDVFYGSVNSTMLAQGDGTKYEVIVSERFYIGIGETGTGIPTGEESNYWDLLLNAGVTIQAVDPVEVSRTEIPAYPQPIQNTGDNGIDVKLSTPILPNEYQQVEYIESTGTQYIDTGIIPRVTSTNQTGIEVTYQYTILSPSFIFGSRTATGAGDYFYHNVSSNNNFALYIDGGGGRIRDDIADTKNHTLAVKSNRTIEFDGQEVDFSYINFTGTYSVYLFACNQAGSAYLPSQIKLYSCRMTDSNGNLVRDYIPCYRKTDGVIGLYDIVNNEFKTNQGIGTFKKGNDCNQILPIDYQRVEYIESSGTQYIDTGYKPNGQTSVEIDYQLLENTSISTIFGVRSTYLVNDYLMGWSALASKTLYYSYGTNNGCNGEVSDFNRHLRKMTPTGAWYDGRKVFSWAEQTFTTNANGRLFGRAGTTSTSSAKVWSCKIWDGNSLIRDFIPCYRKSDGEVGLYDLIESKFYTNRGSGTFEKGKDMISMLKVISTVNIPSEATLKDGTVVPLRFAKLGTVNNVAINKADTLTIDRGKVTYTQYLDVYQPQAPYVADLSYYSYSGTGVRFNTLLPKAMTRRNGISSHGGRVGDYYGHLDVWVGVNNTSVWWQGIVSKLGFNGNWANKTSPTNEERAEAISQMEDYFATQEANGTPFQVLYELKTPIKYDLTDTEVGRNLLNLIQHNGTTIITVTNDKNLTQTVAAKYLTHA